LRTAGPLPRRVLRLTLTAFLLLLTPLQPSGEEKPSADTAKKGPQTFAEGVASLTSPALRERQALRRELQRRGYSNVLYDLARRDPLSALISYARVLLEVEWHIPHTTLYVYIPVSYPKSREANLPPVTGAPSPPMAIPLQDDWAFPEDPWREK
jgi:hypothetical protein